MKIVKAGIDLGNSMMKGATFIDGKAVLKKLPNKLQTSKTINSKARKMIINGQTIYFGVGELNNNILKHTRKYLLEQALVMIHELYPEDNELKVDLRLGLPPKQFFNDSYLKEFESLFPISEPFNFEINKVSKKIILNSVETFVEGYSGFVSLIDSIDTKQDLLSIDVGGGTTDLCSYKFDYEDNAYYPDEVDTLPNGIIDLAEEVANHFNSVNNADINKDLIDQIFKNNLIYIEWKDEKYPIDDYMDVLIPTTTNTMNKITNKFGQIDKYVVIGIGGGYKTFNKMIKSFISKEVPISADKQFYANALGYLVQ